MHVRADRRHLVQTVNPTCHLSGPSRLILSNHLLLGGHLICLLVHLNRRDAWQRDSLGYCSVGVVAGYDLDAASVEGRLLFRKLRVDRFLASLSRFLHRLCPSHLLLLDQKCLLLLERQHTTVVMVAVHLDLLSTVGVQPNFHRRLLILRDFLTLAR